jgi:hypothetical protein
VIGSIKSRHPAPTAENPKPERPLIKPDKKSIRVLDFRAMVGTIGSRVKDPGNVPILLWNALYDSQGGSLTQPETFIVVLGRAIGPGVQ